MKFSGGPVNANRGFSAALHARATRGILFSYGSIARAPSFQRLHLTWGEEEEYSLFVETILPCIDSNGAFFPSSPNFPCSHRYDTRPCRQMRFLRE